MTNNLNKNLNPAVFDKLLSAAAKKMGCSESELKRKLESGELEKAMTKNPDLRKVMSDPALLQRLLNDPNASALLSKFMKK